MDTASATHLQPHGNGFLLPNLPNTSTSSLMDAVVGGGGPPRASAAGGAPSFSLGLGRVTEEAPLRDASKRVNGGGSSSSVSGEKKEDAAQVAELERKLEKRRSLIPHLESELAALEAQIKAAEERLTRAAGTQRAGGAQ